MGHEGRIHSKIDVEVEFELKSDKISLPNSYRHRSLPQIKESFSLSRVESLAHVLNRLLLILDKVFVSSGLIHLLKHRGDGVLETVSEQVLLYRRVYVLLGCCELV